jgi:hypothetical protein
LIKQATAEPIMLILDQECDTDFAWDPGVPGLARSPLAAAMPLNAWLVGSGRKAGLFEINTLVGRGGLEPPTSAVTGN